MKLSQRNKINAKNMNYLISIMVFSLSYKAKKLINLDDYDGAFI